MAKGVPLVLLLPLPNPHRPPPPPPLLFNAPCLLAAPSRSPLQARCGCGCCRGGGLRATEAIAEGEKGRREMSAEARGEDIGERVCSGGEDW